MKEALAEIDPEKNRLGHVVSQSFAFLIFALASQLARAKIRLFVLPGWLLGNALDQQVHLSHVNKSHGDEQLAASLRLPVDGTSIECLGQCFSYFIAKVIGDFSVRVEAHYPPRDTFALVDAHRPDQLFDFRNHRRGD